MYRYKYILNTAYIVRWFFWGVKNIVIMPLSAMVLIVLFFFWKDNITPGTLLVQEIELVREKAPVGLYPVRECTRETSALPGGSENICRYRNADKDEYVRDVDLLLIRMGKTLWIILVFTSVSLAVLTGKYPRSSGE
ncbi:protein TraP [Escherichia coli]|uniref:conjugal transfer protein TraP n=1 Tax=Escherichia TaxID=561 RepID=UPI0015D8C961|nr:MULTISPECIES: conjugal transfer protein TraP [Escherichia]EHY3137165.1 protein TraP [Escherichia coli]MBA7740789.1 protein TraP [Escherichia marmotae]MBA7955437.1 protein TraP [Escherichia marmotae]MCI5377029.1 protein TraP [Escherichia coli]